jgi:plasmid rolling circle replication initiator protein Rep
MTGEVLDDRRKNGKPRPWKRYKWQSLEIAGAFQILGNDSLAERIAQCGSRLEFAECPNGHERKLVGANFCRSRLCAMCSARRALLIGFQVRSVFHAALLHVPGSRLIFLTLTMPNVSGDRIGAAITDLYSAFQRLWRTVDVKKIATGYFRALEVKYSKQRGDYHPHLHVLILVPGRYFEDWYIERQRWVALWQRAARNSLITQVDVRAVKPKTVGGDRLAGAAAEVSKYTVTAKDMIQSTPAETARVVGHIHAGLKGRRLAQFGGLLSKLKKQLKLVDAEKASSKDLIAIGDDPSCRCLTCQAHLEVHVYCWLGGRNGDYVG